MDDLLDGERRVGAGEEAQHGVFELVIDMEVDTGFELAYRLEGPAVAQVAKRAAREFDIDLTFGRISFDMGREPFLKALEGHVDSAGTGIDAAIFRLVGNVEPCDPTDEFRIAANILYEIVEVFRRVRNQDLFTEPRQAVRVSRLWRRAGGQSLRQHDSWTGSAARRRPSGSPWRGRSLHRRRTRLA